MPGIEPKKAALLRTLDILREHSDAEHWLEQDDIVYILEAEYGITLERKAVSRNIDTLIEMGYDIEKTRRGCYLVSREFEDSELRLLIDSVLSSRLISPKQSKALIEKLKGLSSKYFAPRVKHIHTLDEWNKNENPALFYNIDIIDEAIEKKRKLRFMMNSYGIDKKLHPGQEHIVSPLKLLMKEQCYYLLCVERLDELEPKYEGEPIVRMLAVDVLSNVEITGKKAEKHKISEESYEQLFREHPEMESFFFDEAEYITFVCPEARIGKVIATFGKNVRISKIPTLDNDGMKKDIVWLRSNIGSKLIKVTVKTTSYAAMQFVRKNAPYTMVLAPERLKKSILREQYKQHEFSMMIEDKIKKAEEKR